MSSLDQRNARLDGLLTATKSWADKRRKELTERAQAAKSLLKGRTGSERLVQTTVQASSEVVASEIEDFLLAT